MFRLWIQWNKGWKFETANDHGNNGGKPLAFETKLDALKFFVSYYGEFWSDGNIHSYKITPVV